MTGAGSGAVQRELKRLSEAGLVTSKWLGNQRHYQANSESPIFDELTRIVQKTFGMAHPIRDALKAQEQSIQAAFVFGSVAARQDVVTSDIDLFLMSENLASADVIPLLLPVEERLGRSIHLTIYTPRDYRQQVRNENSFLKKILSRAKIWVIGDETKL